MFRLMRNVHLILGIAFFFYAMLFALSSLTIIYRPWLKPMRESQERTVQVTPESSRTPRALAFELMQNHGLKGELRDTKQEAKEIRFSVVRPGTESTVIYSRSGGEVKIQTHRAGFLETLVSLHTNHGFWHDFVPSNAWSLLSLLGSVGLFFLGATGIYLWFCHDNERLVGAVILALGLIYSLMTLVLSRLA
jgi:hypothetical protein